MMNKSLFLRILQLLGLGFFWLMMALDSGSHAVEGKTNLVGAKQIAMGYDYGLYIREGSAHGFALDAKHSVHSLKYYPYQLLRDAKAVYAGEDHFFILKENGELYAFGSNEYGQLGDGSLEAAKVPKPVMKDVIDVAAGAKYSLVVKRDYSLWGFGLNDKGQLGLGHTQNQIKPVKIMDDVLRVSCGVEHSLALKTKGELYGFGDNSLGQLGTGSLKGELSPVFIMKSVEYMAAGASHSLILSFNGDVHALGSNFFGEGLRKESGYSTKPVFVKNNVAAVSAGFGGSFVLDRQGGLSYHGLTEDFDFSKKYELSLYQPIEFELDFTGLGAHNYDSALALTAENMCYLLSRNSKQAGSYAALSLGDFLNLEGISVNRPILPKPQFGEDKVGSVFKQKLAKLRLYFNNYYNNYYRSGNDKLIAITFDDGPSPYTDRLLEALKAHDAEATFFVLGSSSRYYTDILKKMRSYGFEIASHSYNHSDYTQLSDEQVRNDLRATDAIIESAAGLKPGLFRPPYGAYNNQTLTVLKSEGKAAVLWNIDTMDWANRDADYVKNYVLNHASDGSIILLHDIHKTSVDGFISALPELVDRGFRLVTVTELMKARGRSFSPGTIIFSAR